LAIEDIDNGSPMGPFFSPGQKRLCSRAVEQNGASQPAPGDIDRKAELEPIKEVDVAEVEEFWESLNEAETGESKNSPVRSTPSPGKWRRDGTRSSVALKLIVLRLC
jgi:hypothetical protein